MLDLLKLTIVFILIIILLRRHLSLGWVMLIASAALGILYLLSPLRMLEVVAYTATQFSTINLILALVFIMFLETFMRTNQMLSRMVESFTTIIGDKRIVMAMLPAFLGFLPSAGGARFSAPMVDEVARDLPMSPSSKSFVNYWYRHIWEYVFPLYPGIILAAEIVKVPLNSLMIHQFPLALAAVIAGAPVAFRGLGHLTSNPTNRTRENFTHLLAGISPVLAAIILVLVVRLDISLSIALVLGALLIYKRYSPKQTWQLTREAFSFSVVILVFGVLLFKDVLAVTGSIDGIRSFFIVQGVPPVLVILILPFVVGLLTGVTQGMVGVTFPLIVGLSANGTIELSMVALAYASGFAGVMLSPMHLCLPMTTDHFRIGIGSVVKMAIAPEIAVIAVALGLYVFH